VGSYPFYYPNRFVKHPFIQCFSGLKKSGPTLAAIGSGSLLFLSFPPFEVAFLGWVALIPLVIACAGATPHRAVFLGWLAGAVFFLGTLFWLRHVSWIGWIALAFYCALYFIPFALFISLRCCAWRSIARFKNLGWILGAAAVWTSAEYVRAICFTGFGWNLLGISQYAQASLIQIAELGGVYLLSALMVFVNVAGAVTLLQYRFGLRNSGYRLHLELMSAFLLVALASSFGLHTLLDHSSSKRVAEHLENPIRTALVQPNIPEVGNWELADPELIYERLNELTDLVGHILDLDLVIWPETALPDCVRYSTRSAAFIQRIITRTGIPLLTGSMDCIWRSTGEPDYFNSSMLFNTHSEWVKTYNKQHLVLFGETIPFDEKISLINALTPIRSSFKAGQETTLFQLPNDPRNFSVLICFEDTLPYLSRRAARAGATWLVNQTNDSWFDPDCGSKQHLANAVFRSVETRLPMLRCTNTGITCAIDPTGKITQTLDPRTQGFHVAEVVPVDAPHTLTFYTRFGDLFAQTCLATSLLFFLIHRCRKSFNRLTCSSTPDVLFRKKIK